MSGTVTFTRNTEQITNIPIKEIYVSANLQMLKANAVKIHDLALKLSMGEEISPVIVKFTDKGYEVIDGSDTYYAAKINGISQLPCIVQSDDEYKMRFYSQISAIQNQDSNFFCEAEEIEKLISHYGITQEDAASYLGKAQSTIANKLRLLRLTREEMELITSNHLTERHARALLRIASPDERMQILNLVIEENLNVEKTEQAVDKVIGKRKRREPYRKRNRHNQSVRTFMDMIARGAEGLNLAGIPIKTERFSNENGIEVRIRLPRDISENFHDSHIN